MARSIVLITGDVQHQKLTQRQGGAWVGMCTCGTGWKHSGRPGDIGQAWREHVESVADGLGIEARESKYGKSPEQPVEVVCHCEDCHVHLRRTIPNPNYLGPVGKCPRCRGRLTQGAL